MSTLPDVVIRPGAPDDARAIAAVAGEVWPEEPLDASAIEGLIARTERGTTVAELDGTIVGFVDGFLTRSADGAPRWEVDLLAVSPRAQGHGIGRALVGASLEHAAAAEAGRARGLIRVGNVASERVFAVCGFSPDAFECQLWIAHDLAVPTDQRSPHLVPVRTFRYEGVWLEDVTAAGLSITRFDGPGLTGALISVENQDAAMAARAAGLQSEGEFRFWHRMLRSEGSAPR